MVFMGTYTPKLDEKGRVFLPAKFRDRLSEGVVVTRGQEKCLFVWPADVFEVEAAKATAMSTDTKDGRDYQRMFFSGGEEGVPDKQGRLGIAAPLRTWAGLDRDVVVIGVANRLEIWDPTRWDDYSNDAQDKYADRDERPTPV